MKTILPRQAHYDQNLIGVVLLGSALILWYAMQPQAHNTALVGLLLCKPLVFLFGDLAGLVPIMMGCIGAILAFDDPDPLIVKAMSVAAYCYLLMFCQYFQTGFVGHLSSNASKAVFGDFSPYVLYASFALLSFSMLGISFRRTMKRLLRAAANFCWMLWEIRVPNLRTVFGPKEAYDVAEASIPIAVPVKAPPRDPVIDVEYTVADTPRPKRTHPHYRLPDLSLFNLPVPSRIETVSHERLIVESLASFGVSVSVTKRVVGPSRTRYELQPSKGVKVEKIVALSNDLALALAARSVRIEAPIPGTSFVGVEVPNANLSTVTIREVLETMEVGDETLTIALGRDITGKTISGDLRDMPHLLVAGATGSGKSVCLNNIIASLLVSSTPDHVQMLFIDPKQVELSAYEGIPHLVQPVITDPLKAAGALHAMTKEMDDRNERLRKAGVRNIEEYNERNPQHKLPYIVIIIDELADLMLAAKKTVDAVINRLAAMGRAPGIHLIVATQRPSVDVITGLIKSNIPSRIAFAVSSQHDSQTILGGKGAEDLLGRGDMLYAPVGALHPSNVQGALITGSEVRNLVAFWAEQAGPKNRVAIEVDQVEESSSESLLHEAGRFVIDLGQASTARLQSRFSVGHPKAVRLMQGLEDLGVVGPNQGPKPRPVLMTAEEFNKKIQCSSL